MKKLIIIFATALLAASCSIVRSEDKEAVTISFPDGSKVTGIVKNCEQYKDMCRIYLTDGQVYDVLYTQVDDVYKLSPDGYAGDYVTV